MSYSAFKSFCCRTTKYNDGGSFFKMRFHDIHCNRIVNERRIDSQGHVIEMSHFSCNIFAWQSRFVLICGQINIRFCFLPCRHISSGNKLLLLRRAVVNISLNYGMSTLYNAYQVHLSILVVIWQVYVIPFVHHISTTTTVLRPFFRDLPGEPVPEENFWTSWRKERLTEADTLTIWLGATPSGLTSAHLHHPPISPYLQ